MLGIADYFWRLLPANPILLRVIETKSKRRFDLFVRCGYLGILVAIVLLALANGAASTGGGAGSLADLAKSSAQLFQTLSYAQLALVCFLAPIFTAGAITQEKDSQTYDILLATPLSNGQIVLGSMLSRLFFVIALLVSGIPIFSITQIFGGVAIRAIVQSFGLAAATAFITGSLAMAIAVFKVGTRRTIFSFYLFIVVYMVGTFLLDALPYFHYRLAGGGLSSTSFWTSFNPFLALRTIFNEQKYLPPDIAQLPGELQGWPLGGMITRPAAFYTSLMFFLSFVLISPSVIFLRRLAQSHLSIKEWLFKTLRISTGDRTRKPRTVWSNPIAWREAKTKGSAARATVLRYGFILVGGAAALFLVVRFSTVAVPKSPNMISGTSYDTAHRSLLVYMPNTPNGSLTLPVTDATEVYIGDSTDNIGIFGLNERLRGKYSVVAEPAKDANGIIKSWKTIRAYEIPRALPPDDARQFLLGAAFVELAVILLVVTNAAASTVTREKEDGTLDLLLTTPITSRYYIWGKLRGLVSFVVPLIAVPVFSVAVFIVYDFARTLGDSDPSFRWVVFPEALILIPAMLIMVAAFAAILGMQMSLRCRTTVMAVMLSVGIVMGLCGALGWCGWSILSSDTSIGPILGAFSPFTMLTMLIDPQHYAARAFGMTPGSDGSTASARISAFIAGIIAMGIYGLVIWSMYKSMVKNFDMTIRKQSR